MKWADKEAAIRALERKGKVDPKDLIDAARDSSHPCHENFTWDVHEAASERWRDQARKLIRACKCQVMVEDVTEPVVQYVASPDPDDSVFLSLPKIRSKGTGSAVVAAEVSALLGSASRAYGIALAKQGIVGTATVATLGAIRDQVAELKDEINE